MTEGHKIAHFREPGRECSGQIRLTLKTPPSACVGRSLFRAGNEKTRRHLFAHRDH